MPHERMSSSTRAAWALVLVSILGTAFLLYGRFTVLERRMDDSEHDRHEMMKHQDETTKQITEIAEQLDRIEAWIRARANR